MSTTTLPMPHRPRATSRLNRREAFNPLRSVGLAAAISLHLALAGLMLAPLAVPEMPAQPEAIRVDLPLETRAPPPIPPPPPVEQPPQRPAPPLPRPQPATASIAPSPETAPGPSVDTAAPIDLPDVTDAAGGAGPLDGVPAAAELRLLEGPPPRYPRQALRERLQGEVELLVLVGSDGRPQQVSVARSSGHAMLDRAAREHVERRWVFEPLQRNGLAVPAWVRVPVNFSLVNED